MYTLSPIKFLTHAAHDKISIYERVQKRALNIFQCTESATILHANYIIKTFVI